MQNNKKIVSFDFDGTLQRGDVQQYAKDLIDKGIEVWVVTSRYDELHMHMYPYNATLDDLWAVVDELGIPRHHVRFTCMESKALYLLLSKVIWHLDDDVIEIADFIHFNCETKAINIDYVNWAEECNSLLFE